MSWRRLRTLARRWDFWRAITPAQRKWTRTTGGSAMQWPETRAYSHGRTLSKRPGALSILCSKQALRSTITNQIAGVRVKSIKKFYPRADGITRTGRAERRCHED